MTNLKSVNIGMNKFCGPAVLSILTGKSTDDCAHTISSINGHFRVEGVLLTHLLIAAKQLGFDNKAYPASGSLFVTLTRLVNDDGLYIFTIEEHFVVIEVKDKAIYFCDNHTKEPMPAASSARLLQKVVSVNKVFKRPDVVLPPPTPVIKKEEKQEQPALRTIVITVTSSEELDAETIKEAIKAVAPNSVVRI